MEQPLLALILGCLIGLSLGALGAGGSILTIPALMLGLGLSAHEAATTSLIIVGATAGMGALIHHRHGSVQVRSALVFAAAGVGGSLAGSLLGVRADPQLLTLAFTVVMVIAAGTMWRSSTAPHDDSRDAGRPPHAILRTLAAGTVVGLMTGFFGIGGGFLAVPALVYALGLPITTAVGTSLLVISLNAMTALAPRLASGLVDVSIVSWFVAGGLVGALIGVRIAHRISPPRLKRAFAGVIFATAIILVGDTLAM